MKKITTILLLTIFILVVGNFKSYAQSSYGPWQSSSCFKGVDFCVKRVTYNESARKYEWTVKFRNRYNENVTFSCALKESSISSGKGTDQVTIKANSEGGSTWFLVADADAVTVFIDSLTFGEEDWGSNKYAPCDN